MTPKQERFVQEYLIDLNATQAAIRAGYSEKTAEQYAHQLLKKPLVKEAIRDARAQRAEFVALTQEEIIEGLRRDIELARQAGRDPWKGWELLGKHWGVEDRVRVDQTSRDVSPTTSSHNLSVLEKARKAG